MAYRAADDPPQHVAPTLVRGIDAVGDEEGGGADVVGKYAERYPRLALGLVRASDPRRDRVEDRREEIALVVGIPALDDRGDPLESHAGVDGGLRQRSQRAVGRAVELHEHEVPDLEEA